MSIYSPKRGYGHIEDFVGSVCGICQGELKAAASLGDNCVWCTVRCVDCEATYEACWPMRDLIQRAIDAEA